MEVFVRVSVILLFVTVARAGWHENVFHQLVHDISSSFNQSECWVCSHGPSSALQGWPVVPTATLNITGYAAFRVRKSPCTGQSQCRFLDASQFVLTRQSSWPVASICFRWHNFTPSGFSTYMGQGNKRVRVPLSRVSLGDYPACRFTVDLCESCSTGSPCNTTLKNSSLGLTISRSRDCMTTLNNSFSGSSIFVTLSEQASMHAGTYVYGLPAGYLWACGEWAGSVLPAVWNGTCTIATVAPAGLAFHPKDQPPAAWDPHFHWTHSKLAYDKKLGYDPDDTYLTEGKRFVAIALPCYGVARNVKQLRILSYTLEALANVTAVGLKTLQVEIESLAGQLAQHKLALDYLLSKEGGLCFWLNTTCCHFINRSGVIETDLAKLPAIARQVRKTYSTPGMSWWTWLWSWLPDLSWLRALLMSVIIFLVILTMFCCCIQCVPTFVEVLKRCFARMPSPAVNLTT
uniref:Uncharacterized protein n=1 Tax=Varanus komodoensis TaxID=61221 RepID=A0A8D2J5R0_VARKO